MHISLPPILNIQGQLRARTGLAHNQNKYNILAVRV